MSKKKAKVSQMNPASSSDIWDENARLRTELAQAQEELTALDNAIDLLLERLDTAEAERDKWRGEAHKTNELRQQLAQTHDRLATLGAAEDALIIHINELDEGLAATCAARDALARECNEREIQLARVHEKLAQVRADLADNVQGLWLNPCEAGVLQAELAQAREELAAVDEALGEYCRPGCEDHGVYQVRRRLDYIGETASKRSVELTQACKDREYNASLVEKRDRTIAHVRRELKDLQGANKSLGQQLASMKENRNYWHETALKAEAERDKWRMDWESVTAKLLSAEAALAEARQVAAAWFRRAQEAEPAAAIKELYEEHDQLVDRVEDAMRQIEKYDEAHSRKPHPVCR